jgi:hypothetical protein
VANIAGIRDGVVEFSIDAHIGVPAFNKAAVPTDDPDEKGRKAQGRMQGNRVVHEEGEDCVFESLIFLIFRSSALLRAKRARADSAEARVLRGTS